jgi:hypothetical protein
VFNGTQMMTIAQKKVLQGPVDGTRYCWAGTYRLAAAVTRVMPRGRQRRLPARTPCSRTLRSQLQLTRTRKHGET